MRPQADGSVIVDGSVPIRDLNRAADWSLPDDEATTIAGLVIHEARMIPEELSDLHLPRVPLYRSEAGKEPDYASAHHAADAGIQGDSSG